MQIAAAMRHFTSFFMLVPSPPEDLARAEDLAILGAADRVVTASARLLRRRIDH
jgi:hypothetical protein